MSRIGIIGAGISGLTTAFLLKRSGADVTVFEASDRVGGNVYTLEKDGFTIEQGPNSLLKSPRFVDLVNLLGLRDQVIAADPSAAKRYILDGGRLEAMGPKSFVNGYFGLKTVLSLAKEPFVRSKSPENESVAEFVTRRISAEFLDKAIDPFVSGVYAGDPHDLSMRSAFPKLYEMERDFGSLIMGTFRRTVEKTDPDFPKTFSFKGGLKTLIGALSDQLGDAIRLNTPVDSIGADLTVNGEKFDKLVISSPAWIASKLIESRDAALSETLAAVRYPQVAVVVTAFPTEKITMKLDGFGFLIPSKEKRPILGTLFHSAVFPERAPGGLSLLMTFVGGVRNGDALDAKSDDELVRLVSSQLSEIIGAAGEPSFVHIKRWKKAIPQYRVGYEAVTEECAEFEKKNEGIHFCSNFYRGISMSDCVKNAFETAEKLGASLAADRQK